MNLPVVVSDTSPIRALAFLGTLPLLRALYGQVLIPHAVEAELRSPRDGGNPVDLAKFSFIEVRGANDVSRIAELLADLDPGEAEAIALAAEVPGTLLLIDERKARRFAQSAGFRTMGTLGVLLQAKRANLIPAIKPLLFELRTGLRFFISDELCQQVLKIAGE
jgi:predicted nucleic acid-binding protein